MSGCDWLRPGIYSSDDLSAEDYHAGVMTKQPALSASIAKVMLGRSPRHAWTAHPRLNADWQPEERDIFDLGTVAHVLFLQGEAFAEHVAVCDFPDWRTKASQTARDAAREVGLVPILTKHWQRTIAMVDAVRAQLPELDVDPPMFAAGKPEQTLIWGEDNGVVCKARLDWLHDDRKTADDFKSVTTERGSAKHEVWARRTFWATGCDIEAAFHARGVHALTGRWPDFRFLVAECSPPYGVSVLTLHESVLELAKQKVDFAIEKWGRCLAEDRWPSYPRHAGVVEIDGWQEADLYRLLAVEEGVEA